MCAYFSFICVYDDVSGLSTLSSIKLIDWLKWKLSAGPRILTSLHLSTDSLVGDAIPSTLAFQSQLWNDYLWIMLLFNSNAWNIHCIFLDIWHSVTNNVSCVDFFEYCVPVTRHLICNWTCISGSGLYFWFTSFILFW